MRKWVWTSMVLVALGAAWYLFRPELLVLDATVHEEFPHGEDTEVRVLVRGTFHGVAHDARGVATIHQLSQGRRLLRFTDFETSNGPDLRVYLVAAADAQDSTTVSDSEHVELAALKGNVGEQNYELPKELDLRKYRSVTIWCKRFGVNFATAPLVPVD